MPTLKPDLQAAVIGEHVQRAHSGRSGVLAVVRVCRGSWPSRTAAYWKSSESPVTRYSRPSLMPRCAAVQERGPVRVRIRLTPRAGQNRAAGFVGIFILCESFEKSSKPKPDGVLRRFLWQEFPQVLRFILRQASHPTSNGHPWSQVAHARSRIHSRQCRIP